MSVVADMRVTWRRMDQPPGELIQTSTVQEFTRREGPACLPQPPRRYQVFKWADAYTSVRALHDDGTAGPWAVYPPEGA